MAVRLLGRLQVMNDTARLLLGADGQSAAGDLDEVARPDEVIAAEILVALGEAPRNRQAGDVAARETIGPRGSRSTAVLTR